MVELPAFTRPGLPIGEELFVLTMLQNPLRWTNRYRNYWAFERAMQAGGATLYTAEIAYGDRPFAITSSGNPQHLQLRTEHEIWLKENALNLLMHRLPARAKYIAWIDADIGFARPDWAHETVEQLQHFPVVQMFSDAQDLGPHYEPMGWPARSFGYCYREGVQMLSNPGPLKAVTYPYGLTDRDPRGVYWHPGFAWAARREALDALGGLIDHAILGSADWHMATALIGRADLSLRPPYHSVYKGRILNWQARAEQHIRRDVGYVPGTVLHSFHGAKADRQYQKRYAVITGDLFNPEVDLKRDTQGLYQLNASNTRLRDAVRRVNRQRREDG